MTPQTRQTVARSAGIIGAFTLLSNLTGFLRDILFATKYGLGALFDSFNVANRLPSLLAAFLITGTLSVAFIPVFVEYIYKDPEEANRIANSIINTAVIGMGILMFIVFLLVVPITHLIAPGFTGEKFDTTVTLTRYFLISPIIFMVSAVFSGILNARKRFLLAALAPTMYNIGIIIGVVFLYPYFGIKGLAYGVLGGAFLHLLTQIPGAYASGWRYQLALKIKHPGVVKIFKLFVPRILGMDMGQVSLFIVSIIGSTLAVGTISTFTLANNLQAVPVGIFATSFAIATFPTLSEYFAKKEHKEFGAMVSHTMIDILFFVLPISVLMIVLRAQIARFFFGHGAVNWHDTALIANTLGIFSVAIFAESLIPLFSRAFYAMHNTKTPVIIGLCAIALNAAVSFSLRSYGVFGLAIGFTVATIFNMVILWVFLLPKLHYEFDIKYVSRNTLKILFACVCSGFVAWGALHFFVHFIKLETTVAVLLQGAIAGIAGVAVFVGVSIWLGLKQARLIRRFGRI